MKLYAKCSLWEINLLQKDTITISKLPHANNELSILGILRIIGLLVDLTN